MSTGTGGKFGTLRGDLSPLKDKVDFLLTRVPALYLAVEKNREWVNWDKRVYLSFVQRGDVVLDVGANVGAHTVFFSHLVGARGRVLSFEPIPANIEALRTLLRRRARFDNVTVISTAVGNPPAGVCTTQLHLPGADLTQASLKRQRSGSWAEGNDIHAIECAFTSLSGHDEVKSLDRVDFIKIDVEGGELDVLKGASATIRRHRPFIYCEVFADWTSTFGYAPHELIAFLRSLDYRSARVITGGRVYALDLERDFPDEWFSRSADILFLPKGDEASTLQFDARYL